MGNCLSCAKDFLKEPKTLPIDINFNLPSPLPPWPQGGGFASGRMNLGGLEICQISTFKKVWETLERGPENLGATFFEPWPVPDGFFMLGCYAQPNNKPLWGWVLVAKDVENEPSRGALKMPVDYTLIWSSDSIKFKKSGNGYIWLPIPPDGYNAVGLVATNSPDKPPLDKVRCVRSDLADSCEQDAWIWGPDKVSNTSEINFYGLKPTIRGTKALGVSVGTFTVQANGEATSFSLSCLKNKDLGVSCMPNLTQIEALIQVYSPWIYLHPNEKYMPSSVSWFFNKGALLYKKDDESNPVSIDPTGSNLPQGGSNDGAYWIDLPIDEEARDEVKKGELRTSVAYLHIKPMLGATFTDISTWVFYPFNGPATAKVQLIDIPLGKIGEHVGDWEHVTLRISNFTGELWRVYFSEHSGGTWVNASEIEFHNGNKVVAYASLNGHAFYQNPRLVLQGNSNLCIGIRNDTAESNIVMDTCMSYEVISADYLGMVVEPPWLNYTREWGPKISYDIANELNLVENLLIIEELKSVFRSIISAIPSEVLGEEGPTGPKMKNNWSGDEN
ncbi:vacuolar sorting-associated protein [Thalictrum thalictroides]|uniref:Vacuolar sorting-associated protein n=1 Tax=Thalictrum thalictroides TaxID=46969 RepID=A0A7J6UXV8_THATH|nr:vacuolar sorting-associated protein [Thalictrum thalictroides]